MVSENFDHGVLVLPLRTEYRQHSLGKRRPREMKLVRRDNLEGGSLTEAERRCRSTVRVSCSPSILRGIADRMCVDLPLCG
jgi:hypothetical protein